MKKLIALDMDGTLLTTEKTIPVENKKAIKRAQAAGHIVMICSGRPHEHLERFLAEEGLGNLPISACNGAITFVNKEKISVASMKKDVAKMIFDWLEKEEYPFNIYTDKGVYGPRSMIDRSKKAIENTEENGKLFFTDLTMIEAYLEKNNVNRINNWIEIPEEVQILKFYVFTPEEKKKIAFESFAKNLKGLTVTSSYPDNVEISDEAGNKGTGLLAVAHHFSITVDNTIAIGDNFNDSGMLRIAGLAVAMGNAEEGVKNMCHVITASNDECGVALAIDKHVLKILGGD